MTTLEVARGNTAETAPELHPNPEGLNCAEFFMVWIRGGLPTPQCVSDHYEDGQKHHPDAYNDQTHLGDTETAIPVAPWYASYVRRHTAQDRQQ